MTATARTDDTIPVTLVSGYLGAGKTTLVNRVLENPQGLAVAVIVNDMGEVNVDADLIRRERADEEGIVDLSNGCICCELRGDLLAEANRLAESREFDYLLVEASGISEPIPVARTLTVGEGDDDPTDRFRLDTVVSVVDAHRFRTEFDDGESLADARKADDEPERPLADVLIDQIEFCDVLLLNKRDLVPEAALDRIEEVVRTLQPRAEIIRTAHADVDPDRVLDTGRFDLEAAQREVGWKRALAGHQDDEQEHEHEHTAAGRVGVDSFVYRAERPFHPGRLDDALEELDDRVIRAKGVFRLAGRDDVMGLSQAGMSIRAGPIGEWHPDDERRTELVFIGREMDEEGIRETLDGCFVEEPSEGPFDDPFP